jgi:hypothetical protein
MTIQDFYNWKDTNIYYEILKDDRKRCFTDNVKQLTCKAENVRVVQMEHVHMFHWAGVV